MGQNAIEEPTFLSPLWVFSRNAVKKFFHYYRECWASEPSVETYMKKCMDMIGAGYMVAEDVLKVPFQDQPCTDPERVGFCPRDDTTTWNTCFEEAKGTS